MNLQNIMQLIHGNAVPFALGFAIGHIPWIIKLVIGCPPIKAWIKARPDIAEQIVDCLKADVDEVIAEQPAALPPAK